MAQEYLASQLIWQCLTSKHQEFFGEEEVRCIVMNTHKRLQPYVHVNGGRNYVQTPLELRKPPGLHELLIGPRSDMSLDQARFLLKELGCDESTPMSKSQCIL